MSSNIMMLATATGGTESALCSIDVPANGTLESAQWSCYDDLDADAEASTWQVSFGSSNSAVHDSRQVISQVKNGLSFTTSGSATTAINFCHHELNLPVKAGERIFMHRVATASVTGTGCCILTFSFDNIGGRR